MFRLNPLLLTSALLSVVIGQTPAQTPTPNQSSRPVSSDSVHSSGITLTTGTQLVVVDVIVQDHDGHPVHGLTRSDFRLLERKNPQDIRSFDEHATSAPRKSMPPIPQLPPGTFTNYTPLPDDGTLNILLLDTLNTVARDQGYVRSQLLKYIKQADPRTRVAIFGLTARLTLLQGFTSDPAILRAAVESKGKPKLSALLSNPAGNNALPIPLSDRLINQGYTGGTMKIAIEAAIASLQQFEASSASFQTQARARYTLDAFNQLARYLSAFPGRKNLIWFSGSFPISIQPNLDIMQPYDVTHDRSEHLRETTNLLTRARVAVYPVDAQEVFNAVVFRASNAGLSSSLDPSLKPKNQDDINRSDSDQASAHATMVQMAEDTGGQAFYEGKPLTEVVKNIVESGSDYYTLTYSPSNRDWKGEYRSIDVQLQQEFASKRLKLAYRHGYYADDPTNPKTAKTSNILSASRVVAPATDTSTYAYAAMRRGAPTPAEVPFTVQVLPASTTSTNTVAPHNSPNPNGTFPGPYRAFDLSIATLASSLDLPPDSSGLRTGSVEFVTYVYDTDGKLLNTDSSTIALKLSPANYAKLSTAGLGFHQQISVPAKGESFLRIAVHDLHSGRFGVVEVPVSSVSHLFPTPVIAAAH